MKFKENAELDIDARPSSVFSQPELLPLASKPPAKRSILPEQVVLQKFWSPRR